MKNSKFYDENKDEEKRFKIIKYIFNKFKITEKELTIEEIENYHKEKTIFINEINKIFPDLNPKEIAYILFSFFFIKNNSSTNIINFFDTINSILSHYKYYLTKKPNIKYNNSHFDNYLLTRYESSYIFTEYLANNNCRELKIDNKLFFNYIPYFCPIKEHTDNQKKDKVNQAFLEECYYAHNEIEILYHPFVYKKFKCPENCNKENCAFYHVNDDGESIDMETEVDFDSNEIIDLQTILSGLQLNKEDKKNIEKFDIFLKKKSKENGDFIPTEFNPKTYKIYKCPLGSICKLDKKLCLNFHGDSDKRRNPELYEAVLCPNLYENKKRIPKAKCKNGQHCKYAHNLYEYYYHPEKFRKIKCPQEKNGSYCPERLVCPYDHNTDSDYGNGIKLDAELITDYYNSLMKSYENSIKREKDKLKNIKNAYCCYLCGESDTNILQKKNFLVMEKGERIICEECAYNNNIKTINAGW